IDIEIIEEEYLSNPEAYELLKKVVDKIIEKEGVVSPLLSKTMRYLSKFSKLESETARALKSKLEKYGLKKETITMIINICPKTIEELHSILEIEKKIYEKEVLDEIIEEVKASCREE
ncbi:MAG: DNA-directed RNA polymerase subunit F, partial [Desulfurococcaceae archaeon]